MRFGIGLALAAAIVAALLFVAGTRQLTHQLERHVQARTADLKSTVLHAASVTQGEQQDHD